MADGNAVTGGSGTAAPPPGAGNNAGGVPLTIGGREIDLSQFVARVSKTFLCIGPVCLRSGVGFGAGVGCGAGIGRGAALFRIETSAAGGGKSGSGGFSMPYGMMNQVPGGYQIMNVMKTISRKFPGSQAGVGCGVGVGYGFGLGLQYGAAGGGAGGGGGGGMMGGLMSGMGGMGGGMGGGGMGGMGGMGGRAGGTMTGGVGGAGGVSSGTTSAASDERLRKLEKKVEELEGKVDLQLRMKELEERMAGMDKGRRRR